MMRKLASIQKIIKIEPIEGADRIEKATVLGWQCIVPKGNFKEGDLCVYVEIDSLLPKTEWSSFLWKEGDTKEKYKVKTIKMKGQVSQGLVLDLGVLGHIKKDIILKDMATDYEMYGKIDATTYTGIDVTEELGIEQYIPTIPAQLQGTIKGIFPSFIPKTDEPRIQTIPEFLTIFKDKDVYVSEKLDGTSVTYYLYNGQFGVCSRNIELVEGDNVYWKIARELDIENKLKNVGFDIAIQGEIFGQGIQGNKYKLENHQFRVFNVFDIEKQNYFGYEDFRNLCEFMHLITVPILTGMRLNLTIDQLVELSKGKSVFNNVEREGIVIRPISEAQFGGERASFKVINPSFLLKHGE